MGREKPKSLGVVPVKAEIDGEEKVVGSAHITSFNGHETANVRITDPDAAKILFDPNYSGFSIGGESA